MNIRKQVEKIQEIERKIKVYEHDLGKLKLHSIDICSWTMSGYEALYDINNNYKKIIAHYIRKKIRQLKGKKAELEAQLKKIGGKNNEI